MAGAGREEDEIARMRLELAAVHDEPHQPEIMTRICSLSCQCVVPSNLASGEVTTRTADILSAQMPWRSEPARMPGATGIFFQSMSMSRP